MIRIIKEGTRKQITCDNCGSILSYEQEDIRTTSSFDRGENTIFDNNASPYIICPVCNFRVGISNETGIGTKSSDKLLNVLKNNGDLSTVYFSKEQLSKG